jgi:sigma-E factor negative regulatory protein RseB
MYGLWVMTLGSERLSVGLLGLLLVLPVSTPAAQTPDGARVWLDKMDQAVDQLNYDGTFIYQHDDQLEAVRILHQSDPNGERERLISLNGAAREVIQKGGEMTCYMPDQKQVMVGRSLPRKPFPLDLPDDTSQLTKHYNLVLGPAERMAGHETRVVTITPRDAYRYGYRLWLEAQNGMPLKSDLLDERGAAVEQMMFTNIEFLPKIPEENLQTGLNSSGFTWHRDGDEAGETPMGKSDWQVTRLPDGFMLIHHSRHPLPDSKDVAEHLVYSDALASLSVYIEQAGDDKKMLNGVSRMGAANAYGALVDGFHVTVVGEVPAATVRLVGESIHRQAAAGAP